MANGQFNISKGKFGYYATLPATNDALIVVLLKASGLEADNTLDNYDDLAALLAAANDEADFTNYARKTLTTVTPAIDDTNNWLDVDADDFSYTNAGGAANNSIGKALLCYDPDTTGGTDSTVIPQLYWDCVFTTDGTTQQIAFPAGGFFRAT